MTRVKKKENKNEKKCMKRFRLYSKWIRQIPTNCEGVSSEIVIT